MQRPPSPHNPTGPARACARPVRAAVLWLGLALVLLAALLSGPAAGSAGGEPRQLLAEVRNVVTVRYAAEDGSMLGEATAEALLEVLFPPVTGELRLMQLPCGRPCDSRETHSFAAGDYARGADPDAGFARLPAPYNHFTLHGNSGPVDTRRPLTVVRVDSLPLGAPLFVVLESPELNRDPSLAETALVTVRDAHTGDREVLRLYETGPDTGIFTAAIDTTSPPPVIGDGRLSSSGFSTIEAVFQDPNHPDNRLTDEVIVGPFDPKGVVFDADTGALIDGAEVTLIDLATDGPAQVWGDDLQIGRAHV